MAESVYIHIPFCIQKCKYCSFVSFTDTKKIESYFNALEEEIDFYYKGENLKTLYFGGGTPSLIKSEYLKKVINKFNFCTNSEITLEINPDDASIEYLQELLKIGINRISLGSQTFDDNILDLIGRRHDSSQTIKAVENAKLAGFKNISLDLIYGLPTQTLESLKTDLEIISNLEIQHISTYGLKIEEKSYWGKYPPELLPDDDTQADMYILINNFLEKRGFYRYEISNFAIKGYESKHNLNYWENNGYYGFGVAAHGYIDGVRYSNYCTLDKYISTPIKHQFEHKQTKQEQLEEEIFLGFRKTSGINISRIKERFEIDFNTKYKGTLNKFTPEYIEKTPQGYKLTLKGVLLSNYILSEFLD